LTPVTDPYYIAGRTIGIDNFTTVEKETRAMIEAASGFSVKDDAYGAGRDAAHAAISKLSSLPDILWVFAAIRYDQQPLLDGIVSVAGGIPVIGCTTDGEISTTGFSLNSVVVLALASNRIRLQTAHVEQISKDSYKAGIALAEKFQGLDTSYIQIFSDGLSGNADEIIQGIKTRLGDNINIAGGTAGDGAIFKQTFQYHNERVLSDSLVGVAFEGDFHFATGVGCGWFPVGLSKEVTKAVGNVVYELDGQPALEVYKKFLGKHARSLPAVGVEYPLGLIDPQREINDDSYFLCRATMGVDHRAGSITFAGDVPQGSLVKMTMGNEADIIGAVEKAVQSALRELQSKNPEVTPKVIFLYSCMARKIVLGSKTGEEVMAIQNIVGSDVPIIGFYTYGEYAPIDKHGFSCFHNETATLTIIGE
jgi:hypothetical protein